MKNIFTYCIITMDRLASLQKAIASIEALDPGASIVVLNNASRDQSKVWLDTNAAAVHAIHLDAAVSVTRARNICLQLVDEKYVFFLDDDAYLKTDLISQKIGGIFDRHPRIAVLNPAILEPNGRQERRSITHRRKKPVHSTQLLGYFCAAAVILDREKVLASGGFCEEIDIYGEELELSYRLLRQGHHILFCPDLVVVHERVSADRRPFEIQRLVKHRIIIAVLHLPLPQAMSSSMAWLAYGISQSLRRGESRALVLELFGLCKQFSRYYRVRCPLPKEVMRYLKLYGGRLWF